jgi:hypothetical protein
MNNNIANSAYSFGTDIPKERVTLAVPMITTDHAYIHESKGYSLSGTIAANTTKSAVIGILPPADTAATATFDMTAALSDLTYTAKATGKSGNLLSVLHKDPSGALQPLTVTYDGAGLITVSLGTAANSAINSTAAQVAAAVNLACGTFVTCTAEGNGSGVTNAMSVASLAGGKAGIYLHFKAFIVSAAAAIVVTRLVENATFAGTAATFTPINKNRVTKTASGCTITGTLDATLTETSATTIQKGTARGDATGVKTYIASKEQLEEWVLNPGTQYLIVFTPAGATAIDYDIFWYEEASA